MVEHEDVAWMKGCLTKKRYPTEQLALKVARKRMAAVKGLELSHYFCPTCAGYHLTRFKGRYVLRQPSRSVIS